MSSPARFDKPLHYLSSSLRPPLPSFLSIASTQAPSILEIGCGNGRALLETAVLAEHGGRHPACAACLNYAAYNTRTDSSNAVNAAAAAGSVVSGNGSRAAFGLVAAAHALPMPRLTPRLVHGDYHDGLPFGSSAFSLVYSQHALNEGKVLLPHVEFPPLAEEVARVLRPTGSALLHLMSPQQDAPQLCAHRKHPCARYTRLSWASATGAQFLEPSVVLANSTLDSTRAPATRELTLIEVVVGGGRATEQISAGSECEESHPPSRSAPPGRAGTVPHTVCTLAALYATETGLFLLVQRHGPAVPRFDVAECEQRVLLKELARMLGGAPSFGAFVDETEAESTALMETLRQRTRDLAKRNPAVTGLAMRLKRERQTNHSDAFFKTSAFLSSLIESTRPPSAEYAEMYAATVRSWLRSEWWAPQRRRLA
jgi:SAM-dependent methyltransferase